MSFVNIVQNYKKESGKNGKVVEEDSTNTSFIYQFKVDEKVCDDLIEYHKTGNEYKGPGTLGVGEEDKTKKDSIDCSFFPGSRNPIIKKYFSEIQFGLETYMKLYEPLSDCNLSFREGTNIQYYPPGGAYHSWHFERQTDTWPYSTRALVFMTYLNDVTDQGETEWYYQKVKIQPRKGLSVIWPTDFTHTHRGIPSQTQEKYIVTGWWNFVK
jgi:hypothetical protein|tara:strand:+ start:46 stop:681 length:636 start_codon:yes stop_codon:yes gene_type:complete